MNKFIQMYDISLQKEEIKINKEANKRQYKKYPKILLLFINISLRAKFYS